MPEWYGPYGGSYVPETLVPALQELEKAGLIKSTSRGRVITPNGRSFLDKISNAINATEKNG